jgi:hypothetical protein
VRPFERDRTRAQGWLSGIWCREHWRAGNGVTEGRREVGTRPGKPDADREHVQRSATGAVEHPGSRGAGTSPMWPSPGEAAESRPLLFRSRTAPRRMPVGFDPHAFGVREDPRLAPEPLPVAQCGPAHPRSH